MAYYRYLVLLIPAVLIAETPVLKPRDLFYESVSKAKNEGAGDRQRADECKTCRLAVRYRVQQKQAGDSFTGVDHLETVFRRGDTIRIVVEPSARSYVYAIQRGSSGRWAALLPSPVLVNGGAESFVPAPPGAFTFDEKPGLERIFFLFSPAADVDVEGMMNALNDRQHASQNDNVVFKRLLYAGDGLQPRDLVWEKASEERSGGGQEVAFFAANEPEGRQAPVVISVPLNHR